MSGSPSLCWPASISRVTTSRTWAAVTSVSSSAGPRRTASSTAVQDVRPGSSAATTEYGQPGIICAWPFPRPYTWQNRRSGLVAASGRSQLLTSTASIRRPSAARGSGSPATARRSRLISIRPALTASYSAPCPRLCSGASDNPASVRTGPSAHSIASASSNSASARLVRHLYSSPRKDPSRSRASRVPATAPPADSTSAPCHAIMNATATAFISELLVRTRR